MSRRHSWKAIQNAMLLVGTVLGGGFVSGKELVKFYGGSGKAFLLCSILTGIGYAFIVLLVMKCSKRENKYELSFLSKTAFSKCYRLFDVFLLICYFIIMSAMLAATDSMFDTRFPTIVCIVLCFVFVQAGLNGLKGINCILVPFILAFLLFVSLTSICKPENTGPVWALSDKGLFASLADTLLYISMNMLTTCGVLSEGAKDLSGKEISVCAVLFGIIMFLLVYLVGSAVLSAGSAVTASDLPILDLSRRFGSIFQLVFKIVLLFGIFTTLISSAYPMSSYFKRGPKWLFNLLMLAASYGFSRLGFSVIVEVVYPVMGLMGAVFFLSFAINGIPIINRKNSENWARM